MPISERHDKTSHAGGVHSPDQRNGALRVGFSHRTRVRAGRALSRSAEMPGYRIGLNCQIRRRYSIGQSPVTSAANCLQTPAMEAAIDSPQGWIETRVPARLDRLPWSGWHWLIVVALGITWILDGLEVTLSGALAATLKNPVALGLTNTQVGATATAYLAGAVIGALFFGYLTDRWGRKKLFYITLGVYLVGTALSGLAWSFWSFAIFRALTGAGIGGEYAAINSAIDELIPARLRGQVDLAMHSHFSPLGAGESALAHGARGTG
jgi:hypothetical protein